MQERTNEQIRAMYRESPVEKHEEFRNRAKPLYSDIALMMGLLNKITSDDQGRLLYCLFGVCDVLLNVACEEAFAAGYSRAVDIAEKEGF